MKEYINLISNKNYEQILLSLKDDLTKRRKRFVITANPETIVLAEKDEQIKNILKNKKNLIVPDGIGIVKAAQMLSIDIKERIPGVDIANDLIKFCEKESKTIYFFGSSKETLKNLKSKLKKDYPNLKIAGMTNGYVKNKDRVFKKIADLKPDVVLVAMGIPYQEKLIDNNLKLFKKGVFIGVGGSLDVISGTKKRAPKIFIKLNLEWLYRLLKEPFRIKRFYNSNIKFMFKIMKIRGIKND